MESQANRIVVGVDGSSAGSAALRWASSLAAASGGEIIAVNAVVRPRSVPDLRDYEDRLEDRRKLLATDWTMPARESGVTVRTVIREEDPRAAVLAIAELEEADLVVLGRTGSGGGPGFLHLGSLVEYAAHHIDRPLAVIPATAAASIERIVVGVDGSRPSLEAISWCAEVAPGCNASVIAVSVSEPYLEWTPVSSADNWRRDVERQIEEWVGPITDASVAVKCVAQRDLHPADGLLEVTSENDGDLLVLGTRGAGGFLGLRAGGVAVKALHRASLPIVLVPPRPEA